MKKNRTIGKQKVMEAAAARGLFVRRVTTVEGRRWEISNGKGLRALYATLLEVWFVVAPRPVKLPNEVVVDGDSPSPSLSLEGRGTEGEEKEGV